MDPDDLKAEQIKTFEHALSCNADYAASLEKQLNELRRELQSNLEKQRLLKARNRENKWLKFSSTQRCTLIRRGKLFAVPHFMYPIVSKIKKTRNGEYLVNEPPINKDTKHWRRKSRIKVSSDCNHKQNEMQCYVPIFNLSKNITKIEKNIIITSTRCEYIEKSKKKLIQTTSANNNNVAQQNKLRNELMSLDECHPIDINNTLLDWKHICKYWIHKHLKNIATDIAVVKNREPTEYERIWKNLILCDNSSWSRNEIKCLKQIVKQYGGHNWIAIQKQFMTECKAQNINKNRSILSIIRYYQQNINPIHARHEWTRNDDEILIYVSQKYGENDHLTQSYYLDRRPASQCYARLQHATGSDENIWTNEEDLVLLLVLKTETNIKWSKVKLFIQNKSDTQCRQRWFGYLRNIACDAKNESKLNIEEIIYIMKLLYRTKEKLWCKWSDISYVLNGFAHNYWNKAYHKYKCELEKVEKQSPKRRKRKKPNVDMMRWKKNMIINSKYVDPSLIAHLFCILFGGKSGYKLFYDEQYCKSLLQMFNELKSIAIKCQQSVCDDEQMLKQIKEHKTRISNLVNHEKFQFDEWIADLLKDTVYFDDSIDSMQNYKLSAKIQANRCGKTPKNELNDVEM